MSLQGPILIVADKPSGGLAQAFTDAGAFPIVEASWAGAPTAAAEIKPSAIVLSEPDDVDRAAAAALIRHAAGAVPLIPMFIRVREDMPAALPGAIAIADDAPAEQLIARVVSALRLRTLHSTVLGRAKSLKDERNIVAELPAGDPLDDATVLLIGRGRHHPTLSVAVGERMGVIGALSIDHGAACLKAREIDGIIIGDCLAKGPVDAFSRCCRRTHAFATCRWRCSAPAATPRSCRISSAPAIRWCCWSGRRRSSECGHWKPRSSACSTRLNARA
jgi:hypothetical protein